MKLVPPRSRFTRAKVRFAFWMAKRRLFRASLSCPYCRAATDLQLIGRKRWIMRIIRCRRCSLIFRHPLETEEEARAYYEEDYRSLASDLPSPVEAERLRSQDFKGSIFDQEWKILTLERSLSAGKVLDYGCSWGYGVHQLVRHGFEAVGFELSRTRVDFGRRNLGVFLTADIDRLIADEGGTFDAVYSNHVVEHLGVSVRPAFEHLRMLLRPGGLLFLIVPVFERDVGRGLAWNLIGQSHPLAPTPPFFSFALAAHGFGQIETSYVDEELIVHARKP